MKRVVNFAIDAVIVGTMSFGAFAVASFAGASLAGAELCGMAGVVLGMCAAAVR